MSFKQQAISAIAWNTSARIIRQAFQFIFTIILARLLTPRDYGLIGMTMVFVGFISIFNELGLGAALIQKKNIEERHLSSIFWINLLIGGLLTLIMLILAPLLANFYNEPALKVLTSVISINFFIGSFNIVQLSILRKNLDFRKLSIIEISATTIAGLSAIGLALLGFSYWSLALQLIIFSSTSGIIVWCRTNWRPKKIFDKNAIKELFGFSSNLLGFNLFNYWVRNIDNLLIGKFIGSSGLGIYSRAYSLMLLPITEISGSLGQVMFPALSKINNNKVLVKQIYLKMISIIALISFPTMLGLMVVADSFILALLGSQWQEVIPILRLFCLLGMVQSLGTTVGWIYNSQGRTDIQFLWGIIAGNLLISSIVLGIFIGSIMSVALCYSIMSGIFLLYHNFAIPGKLINMTFSEIVSSISGVLGCAILMALSMYLLGRALPSEWNLWLNLLSQVLFGTIIYLTLIHSFKIKPYIAVKNVLWEQWNKS